MQPISSSNGSGLIPTTVVHTTSRKNAVDTNSYLPQSPVSPSRGFKPLQQRVHPKSPLQHSSTRTIKTLEERTITEFEKALVHKGDPRRNSILVIGSRKPAIGGFSYLQRMSAQEALPNSLGPGPSAPLTPVVSPRSDHEQTLEADEEEKGQGSLVIQNESPPDDPEYHFGLPSPVPRLNLRQVLGNEYILNGEKITIEMLNKIFGLKIPAEYQELDPGHQPLESVPLHLSPSQIALLDRSNTEELTFGCCDVSDAVFKSILSKTNQNTLRRVILFNSPRIETLSFLVGCPQLQELCLSWCCSLASDCFGRIPNGAWSNLISLELANTKITNETLAGIPPLDELTMVDISYCTEIDSNALTILLKHPRLSQIRVEGANVTMQAIDQIQGLSRGIRITGTPQLKPISTDLSTNVLSSEAPEYYPFGRMGVFELNRSTRWDSLSQLEKYSSQIANHYSVELAIRKLACLIALNKPNGWFYAERVLQQHDERELSQIMKVLIPIVQKKGRGLPINVEGTMDCFTALWEMYFNFELLKPVVDLNLSDQNLSQIPLSFCKLRFSQMQRLSFAKNPIQRMPLVYRNSLGKTQSFWFGCPNLTTLNFSQCELTSVDDLFYFSETFAPKNQGLEDDEKEDEHESIRIDTLQNLEFLDLSRNRITDLPKRFGISPHHKSKSLTIDLSDNQIHLITPETLEELGEAAPLPITLDLSGNFILESSVPTVVPKNVLIIIKQKEQRMRMPIE